MANGVSRTTYMPKSIERMDSRMGDDRSRSGRWSTSGLGPNGIGHRNSRGTGRFPRHFHARFYYPPSLAAYRKRHRVWFSFFPSRYNSTSVFTRVSLNKREKKKELLISLLSNKERKKILKILRCQENSVEEKKLASQSSYYYLL